MAIYTEKITSLKEGMSISCAGICLTVVNYEIMRMDTCLMYIFQMRHYPKLPWRTMKSEIK